MRDPHEQRSESAKPGPSAVKSPRKESRAPCAQDDLSFDALMQDDLVRMVMASDRVSERDLLDLREVRPLIS